VLKIEGIWVLPRGVASAGSGVLVAVAENMVSCLCCVVPPKNDFMFCTPLGQLGPCAQRAAVAANLSRHWNMSGMKEW
jgi:hypothetical protein